MQKRFWVTLLLLTSIAACSRQEPLTEPAAGYSTETLSTDNGITTALKGHIRIKTEREIPSVGAANALFPYLKITSLQRTFPYCGKFEARTRAEGLHLWYDITFDPSVSLTKAGEEIANTKEVTHIEYIRPVEPDDNEIIYPFNDPKLNKQWHFFNPGTTTDYASGCDINLFPAWEITTGSPEVIVAITDSGIQWDHEDLAPNMWINQAEFYGTKGVDDDGNGYEDDIYGYNFTVPGSSSMTGTLEPCDHGTHVAGIVSAVNNNGLGTCGIAGGDDQHPGVRLMSCQIIDDHNNPAYSSAAIKYSADNGAVISQNSWHSKDATELDESMKQAIDYFVKYAGVDENNVQTGPMRGGIVIFAAGNENTDHVYPGMYDGVLSVAALGPGFQKASYSNYGDWVDLAAPGGDDTSAGKAYVTSTLTGNNYGGMIGTSQACPHVSGVAALIVSKYGKEGFTNAMLRDILVNNTKNIDAYNPRYAGRIGSGLVDALQCLTSDGPQAPNPVTEVHTDILSNSVTLSWIIPSDPDSKRAFAFDLYVAARSIDTAELKAPLADDIEMFTIYSERKWAGDTLSATLIDMEFNTDYYFCLVPYDNQNHRAPAITGIKASTLDNHAPEITPVSGTTLSLKAFETKTLEFVIAEPDHHDTKYKFVAGSSAAKVSATDNRIIMSVNGLLAPAGTYTATLTVSDPYDASATLEITYTIAPNGVPAVSSQPANIYMGSKSETATIDLASCFKDPDGEPLTYTATLSSQANIVKTSISGTTLSVQGNTYGNTTLSLTASDALGAKCILYVEVLVRDGSQEVDLYPTPVSKTLYIRMGEPTRADVTLYSTSGSKVYEGRLEIAPFAPAKIDTDALAAGAYTVVIKTNGKQIQRNIVKI